MLSIVVVNNPKKWNFNIPDVEVVSAKSYLTDSKYSEIRNIRVFNLCRSYRYQGMGYYVSLLAEARGHRAFPSVTTIQDLKSQSILRVMSDEIDQLIQSSFAKLKSSSYILNIYFGRNVAKQYDKLSQQLYNLFQAPLLEVTFVYNKKWILQNVNPVPVNEIPASHEPHLLEFAKSYFAKKRIHSFRKTASIYDLAILVNPQEAVPPSNKRAIKNFIDAAESLNFRPRLITKDDFSRVAEFDALFIRERTEVNHHTYRFARRAYAENMVVIDDPESIVKCTNKVYLAELLTKAKVPIPKTIIVHKDNANHISQQLGLPCVLKQPDGSLSTGVIKVHSEEALKNEVEKFLSRSDLIIAQEYIPTEFDWRVGFIDKQPLFACRYYMAKDHWQIYNLATNKSSMFGGVETVPLNTVPSRVLHLAKKAADLIGDGLYGVDLKQIGNRVMVIEVNDNPTIDHNDEDTVLKEELYVTIMRSMLNRIEAKKNKQLVKK